MSATLKDDKCIYLDAHTLSGEDTDTTNEKVVKIWDTDRNLFHKEVDKAINTLQQYLALDPKSDYVLKMTLEIRKEDL